MQDFVFGFLIFICSLEGLICSQWSMSVMPQVNGSFGQNVILPCNFTHSKQNSYTGGIIVKWTKDKELIFHCNLQNKTNRQDNNNCINLKPSERLSLNAPAQILNLSLDLDAKANGMMLKCFAQGNPVPEVTWTSSSGPLKTVPIQTQLSNYIISSVPFSDQDVYTCQAVNPLGHDQRKFPPGHPNCSGLLEATCFLGCLLFLVLVAVVMDVIIRRRSVQGLMQHHIDVQSVQTANETNVYANVSTSAPVGCETRLDEVYSKRMSLKGRKVGLIPEAQNHRSPKEPPRPPSRPPLPPQ
ncbi:sialic acid binding Ig-like lectin 15, like isoform X3 [Pseudorasbora parva]|uniref:sialic acid binding Ig-like lectin 15, like isoform X3 n=1 Tax=Pseudorasbora parva TaxID=51549 RepID=UPI00351EB03A